jgi:hypothetical protein
MLQANSARRTPGPARQQAAYDNDGHSVLV